MDVDGEADLNTSESRCGRAVHTDPQMPASPEQVPLPRAVSRKPQGDKSPAEWAWERLILYIKTFEETLDQEHEVAIGMTDGGVGVLRIEGIGYFDPDLVTFYGMDASGARSQLIQHVTQLNVALRAIAKPGSQPEPRRIGFQLIQELDKD